MKTITCGIIIIICISCLFHTCKAADYGQSCNDTDTCLAGSFQDCLDSICACTAGYVVNSDANGCNAELGYDCTAQVPCNDINASCNGSTSKCICKTTHYDDNGANNGGTCVLITWNSWGNWGSCPVSCGTGTRERSRTCPVNDGCTDGNSTESEDCNTNPCPQPVNGNWGAWTGWSECTVTCGGGIQDRARSCDSPSPANGGANCPGNSSESQQCNTNGCPVDGGWTLWSTWSACTVTCAGGTQTRSRNCTNPVPQNNGQPCIGDATGSQDCNAQTCPTVPYGQPCTPSGDKCAGDNTECNSGSCRCVSGFYWSGSACVAKVDLGYNCPNNGDACKTTNAVCSGGKCVCNSQYYDDNRSTNYGGNCRMKIELGSNGCTTSVSDSCMSPNAQCLSTGGSCTCNSGYYDSNAGIDGGTCTLKRTLGESCTDVSQCSAQNVQCTGIGTKTCSCQDGYYSFSNDCKKRYPGESCSDDSHCSPVTNSECSSFTCSCKSGYYQSGSGSQATCSKRTLGESCTDVSQCSAQNVQCTGIGTKTCSCQDGYYSVSNDCKKRYPGESCSDDSHCSRVTNSECSSLTCSCKSGYYQSGSGSQATCSKRYLGDSCSVNSHCSPVTNGECRERYLDQSCNATSQCSVNNGECRSATCLCQSGYYKTGSGPTGSCTKRQLGQTCTQTSQCSAVNAVCSGTCQCQSGYYDSDGSRTGGSCYAKATVGSSCPQPTGTVPDTATCLDNNARCMASGGSSYTCQCVSTYYDNQDSQINNRRCIAKKALGVACSTPVYNFNQCSDPSASCRWDSTSSLYKCTCNTGYHPESTECVANKALGEGCDPTSQEVECSDPAALCLGSKCTCNSSHYDSNGLANSGTCSPITNLKVTNVGFTSIQTNQMTLTWNAPESFKLYINRFTVQWKATSSSNSIGESENLASSATTLTLTSGIEPGRAYTVTIISKNDQTQQGSVRSTSVVRYQAAKPGITGGIDWSNSDKDTNGGTINVSWLAPPGYISGYNVKLIDGTTEIEPSGLSSLGRFANFQSSGLKNGYRYTVTIQALSETYSNGQPVLGEIYTAEFKTTPKTPDPPQNGLCKDPTDNSIILSWAAPTVPNGDLVRYHIHVYSYSGSFLFNVSTSGTETSKTVGTLAPGTDYRFRIYTENELYQSSSYESLSNCKTNAKMSTPPTNLLITDVTSRSFGISWNKPENTFSEENYGYVLQITDEQDTCATENIYRCSDCIGGFLTSNLKDLCGSGVRTEIPKTKQDLGGQLTYSASLDPDIAYTVTVTAINDAGRGYPANMTERTLEEAPQKPFSVSASDIETTSLKVSWSINGPRPGKTNFTITLSGDSPATTKDFTVSGFDTREYVAQGLEEYWNYSVTVTATTSVGAETSDETQKYTTQPAAPGEVFNFNINEAPGGNYTLMEISWQAPELLERNSIITSYSFEHYATGRVTSTKNFSQDTFDGHVYTVTLDVTPEEKYTFSVYAVNEGGQKGENITRQVTAPAGVPINIEDTLRIDIVTKSQAKNVQQRMFPITIVSDFFKESRYGQPVVTGFSGCAKNCDFSGIKTVEDFNSMDNWNTVSLKGFPIWRITPANWLSDAEAENTRSRRKRSTTQLDYTVGSEDCSQVPDGDYCNGPLQPGTSYTIVAVSCTNGGCLVSKEYGPFITLAVPDETNNMPMIIGIVVAVVAVIVVGAVVGFILLRRRRRSPSKMKHVSESDDDEFTTVDPAVAKIQRKRPVLLSEIEEYVTTMHKDSNLLFSAEYEELKTLSPKHTCEAADREENRMRNRYINIIPFDHTRVKLSTNGEDDSSDYINANYLPGYSSPREYIGCQGPIPGTIDDFWRMTWEQNVSVIVMLTLCKEGQKIKCEQYWPDEVGEPKQYGDVIVEITSYSNIRTYDYRMFKITNGNTTRVVKHFHFLSWLDFQANVHHDIILDFIQHVRQHVQPPDTSGPMIIHCSAGVGRTGTYIALDHLMQFINEHDFDVEIDIFDLVLKLRENRQHMVQTEQQYVFIHDCVKEIMDRKRRQMENIYENQAFSAQDENIYQNEQSLYANVAMGKSEQNTEL